MAEEGHDTASWKGPARDALGQLGNRKRGIVRKGSKIGLWWLGPKGKELTKTPAQSSVMRENWGSRSKKGPIFSALAR